MFKNLVPYYTDYLLTGSVSMLAALIFIQVTFGPAATTAAAVLAVLSCAIPTYYLQKRSQHLRLLLKRLLSPQVAYGLAAILLLATLSILYRHAEDLSRPSGIKVRKVAAYRSPAANQLPVDRDQLLILERTTQHSYSDYSVKIQRLSDSGEQEEWFIAGLEPTSTGDFTIKMTRGFLPVGPHRIMLYGSNGNAEELIAEYMIMIIGA